MNVHRNYQRYTASGLTPYTLYVCSIAAATVNGTGPYSSSRHVMTLEEGQDINHSFVCYYENSLLQHHQQHHLIFGTLLLMQPVLF